MNKILSIGFLALILFSDVHSVYALPPAWVYCMRMCQSALDKKDPAYAAWRMQRNKKEREWARMSIVGQKMIDRLEKMGDGGSAFDQFKTCVSLCGKP